VGALMLHEEAAVVAGLLVGLNIIDCNMVLKDDDDLDRPVCMHLPDILWISCSCLISWPFYMGTSCGNNMRCYFSVSYANVSESK